MVSVIDAVVFDLDGVLLDSEHLWDLARREVVEAEGGRWADGATAAMQGMSAPEWSGYLHDQLGVGRPSVEITELVLEKLLECYRTELPLVAGGRAAVERLSRQWPLALASSSNRVVIDRVLEWAGMGSFFAATVSSEEVARGKPAPDVYLEAVRRLGTRPSRAAAVEDSANGIRSAAAAGLQVVAVPNRRFPPPEDALALARVTVADLDQLTGDVIDRLGTGAVEGRLDEEEEQSFPASDPHSDWAGPPA